LDTAEEKRVNYKDLEKHVIRFLVGEEYEFQVAKTGHLTRA